MHSKVYDQNLGGISSTPLFQNIPEAILAASENRLPLKEFFMTFIIGDLLNGRKIEDFEQVINFKIRKSNKIVQELEMIEGFNEKELLNHKELLDNSRIMKWKENLNLYLSKKKDLQYLLEKIEKINPPNEEFNSFFVNVKNKIKISILKVEEYIASATKPYIETDIKKWKEERIETLNKSMKENDRLADAEVNNLNNIKEWMNALEESLEKQLGPSLPVVSKDES